MMVKRLTTKEYWEAVWVGSRLPVVVEPLPDIRRVLSVNLPKGLELRFLEIGCAPGGWMAYFHKHFGYIVSGIEYVDNAAELTRKNLQMLQVPGYVMNKDFFEFEGSSGAYDVVFSGGFIEHFDELDSVVGKICSLTTRYVITLVPNLYGVGGLISKTFRPSVYRAHKRIDTCLLRKIHEEANMKTLFCDYAGGVVFDAPANKNAFFEKRKLLSWIINFPFRALNLVFRKLNDRFGFAPRTRCFSPSVLYIGQKI
jgi:SAM-dependent methyltransferase